MTLDETPTPGVPASLLPYSSGMRWLTSVWAWIVVGTILVTLGFASLGYAFANRDYRRLGTPDPTARGGIPPAIQQNLERRFNRGSSDPTPWWIAGGVLLGLSVAPYAVAVRRREILR